MPREFDLRRLRVLLELDRRGSMRATAAATGYSTSAVSAQLAALEADAGVALLERDGRGVRLTGAGRRLVEHARTILAAADAARADLADDGAVAGEVRVAAYSSALAGLCLRAVAELRAAHPELHVGLEELEPQEALVRVQDGTADLAVTYDASLVPREPPPGVELRVVGQRPTMVLAVPEDGPDDLAALADADWIVNSRGPEDEELLRRIAARAGFVPLVRHRADDFATVLALVAGGLGVALLPGEAPPRPGVRLVPQPEVSGHWRMALAYRPGHVRWRPVAVVADRLASLAAREA